MTVVCDDLHLRRRANDQWLAFGQSKTANVLCLRPAPLGAHLFERR